MERLRRAFKARSTEHDGTEMNDRPSRSNDDIVVAVMGVTGVGKSSFIEAVSGQRNIVGHNLTSETSLVTPYRFSHRSVNYVLVDTPGFDDSNLSDREVTDNLLQWLRSSYTDGTRLNGIIYIHSIAKPRMEGSAMKNMRVFRKLCGEEALGNVILATSFWDAVSPEDGAARQLALETSKEFWAGMIAKGSEVVRIDRSSRSACLQLMERIARKSQVELLVQKDFTVEIDSGAEEIRQLEETLEADKQSLKKALHREMTERDRAHEKEMKELKKYEEQVRREVKENQRRADKEYKRSAKEDKRQMRRAEKALREAEKALRPPVDRWEILFRLMLGLYAVACFWNIFVTALLGSVINDSSGGRTPPQINFCMSAQLLQ
ncbi:hypothetical protein IFR05_012841 [Cadophora sp. M221]|nr:hypothetical protein IFR05_012841 [Cadophora sp. M221]